MDSRRSSVSSFSTDVVSYVQIRILGKGAHGRAVLYRNGTNNSLVVWKEIFIEKDIATEVQKEIDILSMMDHPNIVAYYNHFVSSDTIFIEMEYANAGTLAAFLKNRPSNLSDSEIQWLFFQIMYGVEFIHKSHIIHRDIKSLNIFMTTSSLIKIGDFGISKVLSEGEEAHTRVGTPAYMSPEVIQSHPYSTKSDIWSCGCVLFELITRKKLMKCSNELGIALKIINRDFQEIPKDINENLMDILDKLLQHNPMERPTASEILKHRIWNGEQQNMMKKIHQFHLLNISPRPCSGDRRERSIVSLNTEVFIWGGGKSVPVKLEEFTQKECAMMVAVGINHFAILTVEKNLYTWTANQSDSKLSGHLGHSKNIYKAPHLVSSLKGISIKAVSCGAESTMCMSTNGDVYTCGSNYYGQLGLGNNRKDVVETFTRIQIRNQTNGDLMASRSISSGLYHASALAGEDDHLFMWGCGEYGRLGLNSEEDVFEPTLVELPSSNCKLKLVHCGPDNSFVVLKDSDRVMACGNNKYNKLGINVSALGLMGSSKTEFSYDVPFETKFKVVRFLRNVNVVMISSGKNHTAIIDEFKKLYIFGQNKYGQLGLGDTKPHPGINEGSRIFMGKRLKFVSCGDKFTIATTYDDEIYAWGCTDNGRLGLEMTLDQRYVLHPRPLFGSLYKCADLKTCGWQTIMITERVLHTNTIAASTNNSLTDLISDTERLLNSLSTESSDLLKGEIQNSDLYPFNFAGNDQSSDEKNHYDTKTSDLPLWLQDELNSPDCIPINKDDFSAGGKFTCDCGCQRCSDRIKELERKLILTSTKN